MKQIKLVGHMIYVQVDDEDYELLNRYDWWICRTKYTAYAQTKIDDKIILMHRLILPLTGGLTVDHKDGNGLNNQKENLRPATVSQQKQNSRKQADTSSVYKGVHWNSADRVWVAAIYIKGKQKYLGRFQSEIAAAKAYNRAAKEHFGEFAKLNVLPIIKVS
jgi:hypothetical protein